MSALAFTAPPEEIFEYGDTSLSKKQKARIRDTFNRLSPASELVGTLFFLRLFDIDPSLRDQFGGAIKPQARRMMAVMKLAVLSINTPENFEPTLRLIGARYRDKGLDSSAYITMAEAMLWTLEKSLQGEFGAADKRAWAVFLTNMSKAFAGQ
ncbi:globin domain-containing protein [Methyloligella sp. 2.7D]|uniref:globin domain-containing protein n=1 Tax=unclassified Methyloligella TaxID=2625955 RepID=UPI00157CA750|nr:globin domain-containing protein [Methyloligella sp. GL2]QKP76192.1 hypothetical protein HT051_01215 [Methyloligella sp. GL2]